MNASHADNVMYLRATEPHESTRAIQFATADVNSFTLSGFYSDSVPFKSKANREVKKTCAKMSYKRKDFNDFLSYTAVRA